MMGRIANAPDSPPADGAELTRRVGREVVGVVPNVETVNGLATLKGLGAAGLPCYAMLEDMGAPGIRSRYATERVHQPNPHHEPEVFLDALSEIARTLDAQGRIGVLVPANDAVVKALADHPREFGRGLVIHIPAPHLVPATLDKKLQVRRAIDAGVPVPRTYFDTDLAPLFSDLERGLVSFPLLIKGSGVLTWKTRKRFRSVPLTSRAQLEVKVAEAREDDVEFVIQEIIPGGDETLYTFGSYRTKAGHLSGTFTGRKLRQRPRGFGTCRVGESLYDATLVDVGARFLEAVEYFGISQVEFKWDERDHLYKLMEINPRSWSWIGLPIALGINLPFMQVCDALGQPVPEQHLSADSPKGLWINFFDDFRASIRTAPRELPFLRFVGYRVICEPHFAENDPGPGRAYYADKIRGMGAAALRRLNPRRTAEPRRSPA